MGDFAKIGMRIFLLLILFLFTLTAIRYSGHFYSYFFFSFLLNGFLFFGFRKNRIFFETFLAIFFWLGFWLKFSIRVALLNGTFREAIGNFSSTPEAYDFALNITSVAIFGFIVAGFIREKVLFASFEKIKMMSSLSSLSGFYQRHRKIILILFVGFFIFVGISNYYFGIYQRGTPPQTYIEGLSGIYTWLLLFGLSSISAVLFDFELGLKKQPEALLCISLFETFVSSVSILSRGMILNASSLMLGFKEEGKKKNISFVRTFRILAVILFLVLFLSTIVVVNKIRMARGFGDPTTVSNIKAIAIDRFVGIEGVMSVTSYPHRGWDLMKLAWQEKYSDTGTSFYDLNIITSPYIVDDLTKNHFISLPGIIGFLFYSDSIVFLFVSVLALYFFCAMVEGAAYKYAGGNLILCSLIGQVLAYRLSSFGYVPSQSYLLVGAVVANIGLFYLADKIVSKISTMRFNLF